MNRKQFLQGLAVTGAAVAAGPSVAAPKSATGHPRAIAMWDFSWLERRWPGAGYEDWDHALDELVERGYNALRIDPYPHLIAVDPDRRWLLKPVWDTQDWGAPAPVEVQVRPALHEFLGKCRDRDIKVGLSCWFREDASEARQRITGPKAMADAWIATLDGIRKAGLLDTILYVDLCNEWPGPIWASFLQPPLDWGQWANPRALAWMRAAIAAVRAEFPQLPLLFSTNNERVEEFGEQDMRFVDAIEHHLWMSTEQDDEFLKAVGYNYERFSEAGYLNVQAKAAALYAAKPAYWRGLLTDKIARLAAVSRGTKLPLMTTECWGIIDYKDWPMMPWDWVKELCALGARTASATERWAVIATSNFAGPQFHGMWRDVAWHRALTDAIRSAPLDMDLQGSRLSKRL